MCGIAGLLGPASNLGSDVVLRGMAQAIRHRGPDDEGFFTSNTASGLAVGLAHRRLSIIDLAGGHQPMASQDGRCQIVFNGEIYNFAELRQALVTEGGVFRTHSDTEVILEAYRLWGLDCLSRFVGMFAFALWDGAAEQLVLARDRFGKKPLFLREHAGTVYFASEIKALLQVPGADTRFDSSSLVPYLAYRYVPGPGTMFEGVRKLPPGSVLVLKQGQRRESRWYNLPDAQPAVAGAPDSDEAAVRGFEQQLDEAVRCRMVSDVPFGAFLSGGIDSSAVVAMMARHSALPVRTFSVGFAEAAYSELQHAAAVARAFGTVHHELQISSRDVIDQLPAMVRFRDAPVSEPSDIPIHLLSVEARRSVKMVLTGEGSDEILGGYPKHVYEPLARGLTRRFGQRHRGLLSSVAEALPYRHHRAKTAAAALGEPDFALRMPRWFGALDWPDVRALVHPDLWPGGDGRSALPTIAPATGNTALRDILHFDQSSWLPDNLLERGDRMTMAASIEARMPFMDHRLLAYVAALPDRMRVRSRTTKWLLRESMKRVLPAGILERPKVGFRVPVNEWFRGPMTEMLDDALVGPASRTRRYLNGAMVDRVLAEHRSGRRNHEKTIWMLLNLELLHRAYAL